MSLVKLKSVLDKLSDSLAILTDEVFFFRRNQIKLEKRVVELEVLLRELRQEVRRDGKIVDLGFTLEDREDLQ